MQRFYHRFIFQFLYDQLCVNKCFFFFFFFFWVAKTFDVTVLIYIFAGVGCCLIIGVLIVCVIVRQRRKSAARLDAVVSLSKLNIVIFLN
jgi:uncharacterized membrane protein